MQDDWKYLRKELDRVEGRVLDFGSYAGMEVEKVARFNRPYLSWCLEAVPLRHELRRTILRVLTRSRTIRCEPMPRFGQIKQGAASV